MDKRTENFIIARVPDPNFPVQEHRLVAFLNMISGMLEVELVADKTTATVDVAGSATDTVVITSKKSTDTHAVTLAYDSTLLTVADTQSGRDTTLTISQNTEAPSGETTTPIVVTSADDPTKSVTITVTVETL